MRSAVLARCRHVAPALRYELSVLRSLWARRPRAAYIGFLGHGNLGDEALLQAHEQLFAGLDLMPYRKSRLLALRHLVTGRPAYDFGILGGGTLIGQHHRWLEAVQRLQALDVPMVCLGTGVASPAFWNLGREDIRHLEHARDERAEWVEALESFVYVGVRGPESRRLLADWGFNDADVVGDTALSLASDGVWLCKGQQRRTVGINVGGVEGDPMWGDLRTYLEEMSRFVVLLCESDFQVQLLPVSDRDMSSNDFVTRSVDRIECTVRCAFGSYADYARAVCECDVFVGQKLHSTIIACMQGVPSLMIEYRPKCLDFMASVGLKQYVVRTDEFTADTGMKMVDDLLRHREDIAAQLDDCIRRFRGRQRMASDVLLSHFASLAPVRRRVDWPRRHIPGPGFLD